jgi:hypothetical protein
MAIELTDYQKDMLKQLEGSGLKVTVTTMPTGTSKSDIKRQLLELAASGAEKPETSEEKKRRLLELARSGAKRPEKSEPEKLGIALGRYCSGGSYDADFDKAIRALRPDWFIRTVVSVKEQVAAIKRDLLELAKSGAPRPSSSAWLNQKDLPHKTVEEAEHAEDVYAAAMQEQRLGRALINYTSKKRKTYDAAFDAEIRALRPDWFK